MRGIQDRLLTLIFLLQAYLAIQNHPKAIQYFERVFSISKGLQDRAGMGRACSRLGDVYKAMGDLEQAQTYHKQLFALSQQLQHAVGQCTALANLGELSLVQGDLDLASEYYHQLMMVAEREKQVKHLTLPRTADNYFAFKVQSNLLGVFPGSACS